MTKKKGERREKPTEDAAKNQDEAAEDAIKRSETSVQPDETTDDSTEAAVEEIVQEEKEAPLEATDTPTTSAPATSPAGKADRGWKRLFHNKKVVIPAVIVLLLAVLAAVPATRYALAGTVLKQRFSVKVVDTETKKPISGVTVQLDGKKATTDKDGKVSVKVAVGDAKLTVEKKYYESASRNVLVPILKQKDTLEVRIKATGRQVPVAVVNKITKEPLADAVVKVLGTETKTDKDGKAVLVLPADKTSAEATISHGGYNSVDSKVEITTKEVATNTFSLTPEGKIFFLSNLSGKLDVVKSNFDGTGRQVVLAGTGKEDRYDTEMVISPNKKYIALHSKRDGGDRAKLFLIETKNNKLTVIDEGDADFYTYGWSGDYLIYRVDRAYTNLSQPKRYALKSYNAPAYDITVLDESQAAGNYFNYAYQHYSNVYMIDDKVLYTTNWSQENEYNRDRSSTIRIVDVDGGNKKDLKVFGPRQYYSYFSGSKRLEPGAYLFRILDRWLGGPAYFKYEDGKISQAQLASDDDFWDDDKPNYIYSPSKKRTLWSEGRDGKDMIFVGNAKGENEKRIATLDEFTAYGWFGEDYVLLSKKGSELYIMSADGLKDSKQPLKVTNFYRVDWGH